MYDWLLFLHVTAAFALVTTVVVLSAFAVGYALDSRVLTVASAAWAIGGFGTLVFGIWLAVYLKRYSIFDGWIIAAIVIWAAAAELGRRAEVGFGAAAGGDAAARSRAVMFHWLRAVAVLALLVVMIFKPGA